MGSVIFIIHKETNYAVWYGTRDGRGRGSFPSEFYDVIGTNPNTQLNYRLKPEFSSFTVGTNTDVCLWQPNGWRGGYVMNEACLAKMQKDIADGKARVALEAPLYQIWKAEQLQDLTFDQLILLRDQIILDGQQIAEAGLICPTLGSDGMIQDCLAANAIETDLNIKRLASILERIASAEQDLPPRPPPEIPGKGLTDMQKAGIGIFLAAAVGLSAYVGLRKSKK